MSQFISKGEKQKIGETFFAFGEAKLAECTSKFTFLECHADFLLIFKLPAPKVKRINEIKGADPRSSRDDTTSNLESTQKPNQTKYYNP